MASRSPDAGSSRLLRRWICLALASSACLLWAPPADASAWKWVDEKGAKHVTDDYSSIPPAHRAGAVEIRMDAAPAAPPGAAPPDRVRRSKAGQAGSQRGGSASAAPGLTECTVELGAVNVSDDPGKSTASFEASVRNAGSGTAQGVRVVVKLLDRQEIFRAKVKDPKQFDRIMKTIETTWGSRASGASVSGLPSVGEATAYCTPKTLGPSQSAKCNGEVRLGGGSFARWRDYAGTFGRQGDYVMVLKDHWAGFDYDRCL